jgi:hypothetical protein
MASGFAGGLAEGLQSGLRLGLEESEQKFEQSMAKRRQALAEQEQGVRANEESRAKARDALGAIRHQKDDLARRLSASYGMRDTTGTAGYYKQMSDLDDAEQQAYKQLGGAELHGFVTGAQKIADDLHYGRRTVTDLSPEELNQFVVYSTGHPIADLLDTADGKSKVGQRLQDFQDGVGLLRQDGGQKLLGAVNGLYKHELDGLLGQHAYDGSVVTDAEFAAPVPHPDSPQMILTAKLTTRDPATGRAGTVYVPVTEDHGHMLAHPDQRADANVKAIGVNDLYNHVGALQAMYQAVNSDPETRQKLVLGYVQGHDDDSARMLDWIHVLGHDPAEYQPSYQVSVNPQGNIKTSLPSGEPIRVLPKPAEGAGSAQYDAGRGLPVRGLAPGGAAAVPAPPGASSPGSAVTIPGPDHPADTVMRDGQGRRVQSLGGGQWQILQ